MLAAYGLVVACGNSTNIMPPQLDVTTNNNLNMNTTLNANNKGCSLFEVCDKKQNSTTTISQDNNNTNAIQVNN